MVRYRRRALLDSGRFVGGEHLRGAIDIVGVQSGDPRYFFQVPLFDIGGVILVSICMFVNKLLILPAVFNDDFCHSQGKGTVRSGTQLQMDVGQFIYCGRHAGIHNNHLATVLFVHLDITGGQMIGVVGVQRPSQKHLLDTLSIRNGNILPWFPGYLPWNQSSVWIL